MPIPLAIPIAMAAIGLGGQIFGGIKSGKAMKKAERGVDDQVSDLTSWYDTEKNKDFLQSNVASSAINKVMEDIENRNKEVESSSAITGASDASRVASKAKSHEQFGDTIKDIASYGTARGDRIEDKYRTNLGQLMGQKTNIQLGKAQNAGKLVDTGGKLLGAAGGMFAPGAGMFGGGGGNAVAEATKTASTFDRF